MSLVCCDNFSGPVIDQSLSYPFTPFQAGRKRRKCRKQIVVFQLQVNKTCRAPSQQDAAVVEIPPSRAHPSPHHPQASVQEGMHVEVRVEPLQGRFFGLASVMTGYCGKLPPPSFFKEALCDWAEPPCLPFSSQSQEYGGFFVLFSSILGQPEQRRTQVCGAPVAENSREKKQKADHAEIQC